MKKLLDLILEQSVVDNKSEIESYISSYLSTKNCVEIRKDLEVYQSAVKKGEVKLEPNEIDFLDDSITQLKSIENNSLLCPVAKKKIKKELIDTYKKSPEKTKKQLCWMNKNIYSGTKLSFCEKTDSPTNVDNSTKTENPKPEQDIKVDDEKKENPKPEQDIKVDDEKKENPKPVDGDQNLVSTWNSKYPCLNHLTPKVITDEEGYQYSYKLERGNLDEKVYYYLNGKCKIVRFDETTKRNVETKKYFNCP